MKKLFFFLLLNHCLCAQDIVFTNDYDKSDIQDAFTLMSIHNFKYKMPEEFKGYYFDLIIKEYYEGKEISIVSQSKRFENMRHVLLWNKETPEYTLKLQSINKNDSIEKFNVRLPTVGLRGRELKMKLPRNEYGWETLINEKTKLIADTEIPILTFSSMPQNEARPNVAVYCELADKAGDYKEWYTKFKVKHCYILLVKVSAK